MNKAILILCAVVFGVCCGFAHGATGEIHFTHVPDYGAYGNLAGGTSEASYLDHKVLVYVYVGGWYNKPTWANPLTSIDPGGGWSCDITTGGYNDTLATEIIAFLIPEDAYQSTWEMSGGTELPADLYLYPHAYFRRSPEVRTIIFAGHEWSVKDGYHGPGPNEFSDSAENVWVDGAGSLHLKITNGAGQWECSELISSESFGYGTYVFTVETRVDILDRNVVLGLFTWDTYAPQENYREIDFEFGRWGDPAGDNSQFVIQPWDGDGNLYRFDIDYAEQGSRTTHVMTWGSDGLYFRSYYGGFSLAPPSENIIADWYYQRSDNPAAGGENVRLNLWLMSGLLPSDGLECEVVVKDFQFLPGISNQPGDVNGDLRVDLGDISEVAERWMSSGCDAFNGWCEGADVNCDGWVDLGDVLAIAGYWLDGWE